MAEPQRIQKLIAQAGLASRRHAEEWITQGRVTINGEIARLGDKADLGVDLVYVNGVVLGHQQEKVYLLLNKPIGYVTTLKDPQGRPTISEFLHGVSQRLFPVGRLDLNTEGLLLLTNDGDLAAHILHPRHKIPKTYLVKISGSLTQSAQQALEQGVMLEEGITAPAKITHVRSSAKNTWFELTITEGRNRQVRRMCTAVGSSVSSLKRVRMANIELGNLAPGKSRFLRADELATLQKILN